MGVKVGAAVSVEVGAAVGAAVGFEVGAVVVGAIAVSAAVSVAEVGVMVGFPLAFSVGISVCGVLAIVGVGVATRLSVGSEEGGTVGATIGVLVDGDESEGEPLSGVGLSGWSIDGRSSSPPPSSGGKEPSVLGKGKLGRLGLDGPVTTAAGPLVGGL